MEIKPGGSRQHGINGFFVVRVRLSPWYGKTMEVSKVLDKGRRVHGGSTRDEVQVEEIPQLSF